jgi:carboxymethylenebutenolidase
MNVQAESIAYPFNGDNSPAYLVRPEDDGRYPAVIVIQEWWGLVPHIKQVAGRFAAEGYVALAPDLYHGQAAAEPDEARKLAMALDRERAVGEIRAAARYLRSRNDVGPKRVGAVGWCLGGGLALSAAAGDGGLDTAVCFYGRPLTEDDALTLRVPVLGHYGSADYGIPEADVRRFERTLAENGVPHQIHIYEHAGHAFFNDTRRAFNADAAADAWRRTIDWLDRHLRPSTRR